jgi:hypothetical protein
MKYRNVELYYQLALDDTSTKIIDLKTTDPISAIRLDFEASNDSDTDNKSNFINDIITKLELVDGSDQLLSLNMKQAQALQFYNTGKAPYIRPGETAGGTQNEQVLLLFGRYLWDPTYYMDLTKFTNPQLKITTNIAAVRAAGDDGYESGSIKLTLTLHVIEEGAEAAAGFFMQKEVYSFTSGTSGDEHVDIPRDYPYAALLMRAYTAGNDIDENIKNLKISCDAGKFIPIDKKVKKIYQMNEEDLGPMRLRYYIYRQDAETVDHIINHDPIISLVPTAEGHIAMASWSWSGRFLLQLNNHDGTAISADEKLLLMVEGGCPHSTIYLPFGLLGDPATYFDPKEFGDIDLVLEQAAASTVQLVLMQLRPYA